jgi:hypothetical protein
MVTVATSPFTSISAVPPLPGTDSCGVKSNEKEFIAAKSYHKKGAPMKKCIFVLLAAALLMGCQSPEKTARDSIAAFNGYLTTAVAKHDAACKADTKNALPVCQVIVRSVRAENAAVTALETYCQLSPGTGNDPSLPCKPVKTAQAGLLAAIANMNQLSSEIQGAAK